MRGIQGEGAILLEWEHDPVMNFNTNELLLAVGILFWVILILLALILMRLRRQ